MGGGEGEWRISGIARLILFWVLGERVATGLLLGEEALVPSAKRPGKGEGIVVASWPPYCHETMGKGVGIPSGGYERS